MKRFLAGLIVGAIIAAVPVAMAADNTVRLFVNGQEINFSEAPPQIINGRTMVPARPLAEALGATVGWDAEARAVVIDSEIKEAVVVPEMPIEDEWKSARLLVMENGWASGEMSDPHRIYVEIGDKRLEIPISPGPDLTGTTAEGNTVRARLIEGRIILNVSDLVEAGFIAP